MSGNRDRHDLTAGFGGNAKIASDGHKRRSVATGSRARCARRKTGAGPDVDFLTARRDLTRLADLPYGRIRAALDGANSHLTVLVSFAQRVRDAGNQVETSGFP